MDTFTDVYAHNRDDPELQEFACPLRRLSVENIRQHQPAVRRGQNSEGEGISWHDHMNLSRVYKHSSHRQSNFFSLSSVANMHYDSRRLLKVCFYVTQGKGQLENWWAFRCSASQWSQPHIDSLVHGDTKGVSTINQCSYDNPNTRTVKIQR